MFKIKEARKSVGITQKELAELVGTSREYVAIIENGHKTPSMKLLNKIAKALNTSLKDLINETA